MESQTDHEPNDAPEAESSGLADRKLHAQSREGSYHSTVFGSSSDSDSKENFTIGQPGENTGKHL